MSNIARLGDVTIGECVYHGTQTGIIVESSSTVTVNGKGVARLGDDVSGDYVAKITTASSDTFAN